MKLKMIFCLALVLSAGLSNCFGGDTNAIVVSTNAPAKAPQSFITVKGEVKFPGQYTWTNGMTLKNAINAAGGFTDFTWREIRVYRGGGLSETIRMGRGFSFTNNPTLKSGDTVYLPPGCSGVF